MASIDSSREIPTADRRQGRLARMRPHAAELSARSGLADNVGDALAGELLSTLGYEQPKQAALADGQVALDGPQLVASDGQPTIAKGD